MGEIVKYEQVKDKVIILRGEPVLLDADVASLYGVETRVVNQAVRNNPDKFPNGYLFKLDNQEVADLRSKILIATSQKADNQVDNIPTMLHRNQKLLVRNLRPWERKRKSSLILRWSRFATKSSAVIRMKRNSF